MPRHKSDLLGHITQIEMTVQALESFVPEDRPVLMALLKQNVEAARKAAEERAKNEVDAE